MRRIATALTLLCTLTTPILCAHPQTPAPLTTNQATTASPDLLAIRQLMDRQTADWNRGDLDSFANGYKNSPDILFVGRTVNRGYAAMLDRYHHGYPTPDAMGKLTFTNFEPVLLDNHFATATGNFHLERSPAGGGNADGIFSLVFEKTALGWKIIRDHTTAFPPGNS